MTTTTKSLLTLTAADLMTREVTTVSRAMSLRAAAHLLSESQISGAPVVDETGECVGVLSATDFMHSVGYPGRSAKEPLHPDPGCFHSPWQLGGEESLPMDEAGNYMTAEAVTVPPSTPLIELARKMTDAHIHRIIVVDGLHRPIGVVSSTDILAAVVSADRAPREAAGRAGAIGPHRLPG
jgi:CBS domain-containing membrane protein